MRWGAAHNTYVQVAAELGIPGIMLFLALMGGAFAALRRAARWSRRTGRPRGPVAKLSQTLMASLVGFAVGAVFLSLAYTDMLYMLLALAAGLAKTARTEAV